MTTNNMPATMQALNKSSYITSSNYSNSYIPETLIGIAFIVAVGVGLYYLNKKYHLMNYIREFFQDQCAYCNKNLAKKEGIRKNVNWEGTMMRRKMAFCHENHMNDYMIKWGEPIGCGCSIKFQKYSFEWWIQWSRIFLLIGFLIFIIISIIIRG